MLVRSAWTGPPAPARYARTGWDTCPASLAPLASLALKILLNATRIYQSLWTILESVRYITHLTGHFKGPLPSQPTQQLSRNTNNC